MLETNYTLDILNLKDVIITKTENITDELHVWLENPRKIHKCPCCGAETDKVHDYREQVIKDIPFGRNTYLHMRKRRYNCPQCGKHFAEHTDIVSRYYRMSKRAISSVINEFRNAYSAKNIAKKYNTSITTVLRHFDLVNYKLHTLPRVLSIDEFKGNAGGEKYQTIVTDPENRTVLDVLPNRFENELIEHFLNYASRKDVEFFVSDMNPHFR